MLCSNSFKSAGVNESPAAYVPNNEERPVFPGTYMGTILLWGLAIDLPIAAVRDALMRAGSHVTLFDQRTIRDTEVELVAGTSLEGLLRIGDERCNLADITGVSLRPKTLANYLTWRPLERRAISGGMHWRLKTFYS